MNAHKILFDSLEWEICGPGAAQKTFSKNLTQLRLLRFSDNFVENDWCIKGHIGYVLDGEMTIDFNGSIQEYKKGDGLWIENGIQHKVCMSKGSSVELVLFEKEE